MLGYEIMTKLTRERNEETLKEKMSTIEKINFLKKLELIIFLTSAMGDCLKMFW